jgi:hypothetical protein
MLLPRRARDRCEAAPGRCSDTTRQSKSVADAIRANVWRSWSTKSADVIEVCPISSFCVAYPNTSDPTTDRNFFASRGNKFSLSSLMADAVDDSKINHVGALASRKGVEPLTPGLGSTRLYCRMRALLYSGLQTSSKLYTRLGRGRFLNPSGPVRTGRDGRVISKL